MTRRGVYREKLPGGEEVGRAEDRTFGGICLARWMVVSFGRVRRFEMEIKDFRDCHRIGCFGKELIGGGKGRPKLDEEEEMTFLWLENMGQWSRKCSTVSLSTPQLQDGEDAMPILCRWPFRAEWPVSIWVSS